MAISRAFVLLVLLIVVATAVSTWLLRRRQQQAPARNGKYPARQAFVIGQLDAIGDLLKDESLPVDDLEAQSATILLPIEAINENGGLTAVIDDTRSFVGEECARRRARPG